MEDERILERERHQIEQILELDLEELQVEEVDDLHDSSDDDRVPSLSDRGFAGTGEFTFDTSVASLHTYLGEVEDTHHRTAFLDGGAILNLPLIYLEGVVLFPEATLPLRVIQPTFVAAVERALGQTDAAYTIGVVRIHREVGNNRMKLATIGTTAEFKDEAFLGLVLDGHEIRQFRRLEDGSLNVVTRGQQRFRLRRCWIDVEGVPCGEIQIIEEDQPLRAPREAFGRLAQFSNLKRLLKAQVNVSPSRPHGSGNRGNSCETNSDDSFECELSETERIMHQSAVESCNEHDVMNASTSSDDDNLMYESDSERERSRPNNSQSMRSLLTKHEKDNQNSEFEIGKDSIFGKQYRKDRSPSVQVETRSFRFMHGSQAFWPYWVYQMYDSYSLAQRAADRWKQIIGAPSMDDYVKKPRVLSFYVASKIPVSESTRQELLEIDGISYRLRREIEILESIDLIRCKNCQTVIARRSDMLVMSSEGPLGAYVNPSGFVHEIMTLCKATGLALLGPAVTAYSWFPGYAWTITNCASCETQMGWLFTATNRKLKPRSFWGIRSCQVADVMHR